MGHSTGIYMDFRLAAEPEYMYASIFICVTGWQRSHSRINGLAGGSLCIGSAGVDPLFPYAHTYIYIYTNVYIYIYIYISMNTLKSTCWSTVDHHVDLKGLKVNNQLINMLNFTLACGFHSTYWWTVDQQIESRPCSWSTVDQHWPSCWLGLLKDDQ